ncbi:MAG: Crp/Fnr family transcriptional regulator [Dehalococcoidia bacterium]|nr:Crp/Fnr family transcriptional regulator [Dehalococcoidia bacterium]
MQILGAVPFFRHLAADELEAVNDLFSAFGYEPQETIYMSGAAAERLFVVAHGTVKLIRRTASGQDILLDILRPGDMFGSLPELGTREYLEDAEAQTSCCVLGVSSTDFQRILQRYPKVALSVLAIIAGRLQDAQGTISQLSAMPVEARIASALLKLGEKLGVESEGGLLLDTPISRQDLAAMSGTTTESASRAMSDFRRTGLIESGRRWIRIKDPDGRACRRPGHVFAYGTNPPDGPPRAD